MRTLKVLRMVAIGVGAGVVLAWTPGLTALAPNPPIATITLTADGIGIDPDSIDSERKGGVVWFIDNQTDYDGVIVKVTNFKMGDEDCENLKPINPPPVRGKLDDRVGENGTGIIAVVVKKNAGKNCYKYDITATHFDPLDPRLHVR